MDGVAAAEMPMPAEGTAAHDALAANRAKQVTRFDKIYKRSKRKPPTKTVDDDGDQEKIVPGKLITRENDMYVMSIGMMLGLRVSLMYNAAHVDEEITGDDMHTGDHYVFPPEGNQKAGSPHTPKHHLSHTFKFKDYAPKVFHRLRLLMGVDTKSYMESVSGNVNYVQFTSNSKSGQFFFFTPDGNYMIKTVTHEEVKELLHIMPNYYHYLKDQPGSFLCRVTGMYRVQMYHLQRTVYFIVMASAYKGANGPMDRQYDCKGSHVGRNADPGDSVKKDNDLLDDGFRLLLGPNREPVMAQMRRDVEMLKDLGFLDYSVLIGSRNVRKLNMIEEDPNETSTQSINSNGDSTSTIGSNTGLQNMTSMNSSDFEGVTPFTEEDQEEPDVESSKEKVLTSPKKGTSFGLLRLMASSTRTTSTESGINDDAAAAMAASMHKLPQNQEPNGPPHTSYSVTGVADKIIAESAKSAPPPAPRAAEPRSSKVLSMPRKSSTVARNKKAQRRVSSRTIQFEYTKKWEVGIAHPVALNEEAALASEIRLRLSTVSDIALNDSDGLPAYRTPPEASWVVPKKKNTSFEEFMSSSASQPAQRTSTLKSVDAGGGGGGGEDFAFASPLRGNSAAVNKSTGTDSQESVGVSDSGKEVEEEEVEEYRLGVIDFLTKYGVSKMAERNFKSFKYERKALSVAPPDEYAARLVAFMEGICIGDAPPAEGNGGFFIEVTLKENNSVSALEVANSVDGVVSSRAEEQWLRASRPAGSAMVAPPPHPTNSRLSSSSASPSINLKGTIISAVKEGSEPWRCDIRVGDRVHRINGELVPFAFNCKQVNEKLKRASRPVYLTLERLPQPRKPSTSVGNADSNAKHLPTQRTTTSREDKKESENDKNEEIPKPPLIPPVSTPIASHSFSKLISNDAEQKAVPTTFKTDGSDAESRNLEPLKIASGSAEMAMNTALDSIQAIVSGERKP